MGGRRAGCLVLAVGPSGAGKDTLLGLARRRLQGEARVVFGRRVVTRAADASEDHDTLAPEAFDAAEARGEFVLSWRAHGHGYGVPRAATRGLWAGETVVFNVSRSVIDAARRRFPRVRVVYVTAPPDVLARRIAARGRDGDAVARLARAEALDRRADADLVIDNVGDSAVHAGALAVFLLATLA